MRASRSIVVVCILVALVGVSHLADAGEPAFVGKTDTIVFTGDSITVAASTPTGFATLVEQGVEAALPGSDVTAITVAKGGAGIGFLKNAFKTKVPEHKPDIVVILIGINDVRLQAKNRGSKPADFEVILTGLVDSAKGLGAKVVICSPLLRGEKTDGSNPDDALIAEYVAACARVAAATDAMYIDTHQIFIDWLKEINPDNDVEGHLTKDGVHPNAAGNALIAESILTAWGLRK